MPTLLRGEKECREMAALRLWLPSEATWKTIFRVYLVRYFGLSDESSIEDLWQALWCRYLGAMPGKLSEVLWDRHAAKQKDPCEHLVNYATLCGFNIPATLLMGFSGVEASIFEYRKEYLKWRHDRLGF